MFGGPAIGILILLFLPFYSNQGERSARRRPVAVLAVVFILMVVGILTYMGKTSPWSPKMSAWSGDAIPVDYLRGRTPLELHGAVLFQNKQCRNCHSLGGVGGQRGPSLDAVATRLTGPEMVRQVIQGGGNMPSYGKKLSPDEVEAIVSFMLTLHPKHVPPVKPSNKPQNKLPRDIAALEAPASHFQRRGGMAQ